MTVSAKCWVLQALSDDDRHKLQVLVAIGAEGDHLRTLHASQAWKTDIRSGHRNDLTQYDSLAEHHADVVFASVPSYHASTVIILLYMQSPGRTAGHLTEVEFISGLRCWWLSSYSFARRSLRALKTLQDCSQSLTWKTTCTCV